MDSIIIIILLFSGGPGIAPRSCIYFRNTVCALPLSELCSMDVAAVRAIYTRGQNKRDVTVTAVDSPRFRRTAPVEGLREVSDYCSRNEMQLTTGCDATAHHIIQGSSDNPQGE